MNEVAEAAYGALRARDWASLRPLLHPYLHWTAADGRIVRGRSQVLAELSVMPTPTARPSGLELRDSQIYR